MTKDILMRLALFFARVIDAYTILIWVRVILSWFVRTPQGRSSWIWWMGKLTDGWLGAFRSDNSRAGSLDFSPVYAIGVLFVAESILQQFGFYGTITLSVVLFIFLNAFWTYGISILFLVVFISLVFRLISHFSRGGAFRYSYGINDASSIVTSFVRSFSFTRRWSEKTVTTVSLISVAALYFIVKYMVSFLLTLVLRIPL